MKKFAALVLALALVLTSVSAFAAASRSVGNLTYATPAIDDSTLSTNERLVVLMRDPLGTAEAKRIAACDPIESAFPAEVADAVAGATDVNGIAFVALKGEGDLTGTLYAPVPFEGNVVVLLGIYDTNTSAYNYSAIGSTVNASGSVTVNISADQVSASQAAPSTILVFIQK